MIDRAIPEPSSGFISIVAKRDDTRNTRIDSRAMSFHGEILTSQLSYVIPIFASQLCKIYFTLA